MKVFCRFAPPPPPSGPCRVPREPAEAVLLMQADRPCSAATGTTGVSAMATGARVRLADPATLSKATFSCDGVFIPTAAPAATAEEQQQHLYDVTCKSLLAPTSRRLEQEPQSCSSASIATAARRIYLAYGQTASGKTYSLFGGASTSSGVEGLPSSAGVVPRYLHDIFSTANSRERHDVGDAHRGNSDGTIDDVFVDLSCFEVYNEAATDLVALSVSMSAVDVPYSTGAAGTTRSSVDRPLSCKTPTDAAVRVTHSLQSSNLQQQLPVWMAHQLYRTEQQLDSADACAQEDLWGIHSESSLSAGTGCTATTGAPAAPFAASPNLPRFIKTEYKATEKQQVLRSLERARCTTFAEAQAVLQALLALRRECATRRNQRSSRGHFVVRVRAYAPAACGSPAAEWVMQHETAFVDLAGSESAKLAEAHVADVYTSKVVRHQPKRRGQAATGAASSSRANSLHNSISLDTDMQPGASLQHSTCSNSTTTTVNSAYHRSLIRSSPVEDRKVARMRRRRETRSINASLLALRKVFGALCEATRWSRKSVAQGSSAAAAAAATLPRRPPQHHAPFKDSVLTAILEPFLVPQPSAATPTSSTSPSSREGAAAIHVVLLVCCSSRSVDFFETVASLRLGAEATAVNPEVVLHALPVQQREQQQQMYLSECATHLKPHHTSAGLRHRDGSECVGRFPSRLFRSLSAPSRQSALTGKEDRQAEVDDFSECTSAPGIGDGSSKPHIRCRPGEVVMSAADAALLRDEARQYKKTAQQLYKQCQSLCESYDECVDELQRCRVAVSERDARIAQLAAELEKATHARGEGSSRQPQTPLPEPLPRCTPNSLRHNITACASPAARTPHRWRLQHSSQEGAGDEDGEVIASANIGGMLKVSTAHVPPLTASVTAESMQAASISSATREGSGRWMVSVSPFSTASLAEGTAARMLTIREDVEGVKDVVSDAGSSDSSLLRESYGTAVERQQRHARCIIDTLLARQIFPSDEPAEPTQSPSPPYASSPYSVLPTPSACGTAPPVSSPAQEKQHAPSQSSCHGNEGGARVAQGRESDSGGSPLTTEADAASAKAAPTKEIHEVSAAALVAPASTSAPRQSYNTARSSSAGATPSSFLEGRGSVSMEQSSCDSVVEGMEAELTAFLPASAPATNRIRAPAASASALSSIEVWPKDLRSRVSPTALHDSPLRATPRRTIAMSMDHSGEVPHAEAVVTGGREDAVEEVVIRLHKRGHGGPRRIPTATCQPMGTAGDSKEDERTALIPPCCSPPLGAVASVPVTPSKSPEAGVPAVMRRKEKGGDEGAGGKPVAH